MKSKHLLIAVAIAFVFGVLASKMLKVVSFLLLCLIIIAIVVYLKRKAK